MCLSTSVAQLEGPSSSGDRQISLNACFKGALFLLEPQVKDSDPVLPRDLTEKLGGCRVRQEAQCLAGNAFGGQSTRFRVVALRNAGAFPIRAGTVTAENQLTSMANNVISREVPLSGKCIVT